MKDSAEVEGGEVGAGFEKGSEGVVGRAEGGGEHEEVEMKGVEREGGARGGADEGVEEEGVRAWDGRD